MRTSKSLAHKAYSHTHCIIYIRHTYIPGDPRGGVVCTRMVGGVISLIASEEPYCRSRPLPSATPPLPTGAVIVGLSCEDDCCDELMFGRPLEPEYVEGEGALFDEPTVEGPVELDAVKGLPDPE